MSGVSAVFKKLSPLTKLIGAEPLGSPKMKNSIEKGKVSTLPKIDTFVDGCAVKTPGVKTFQILSQVLDDIVVVPEGLVCKTIMEVYNEEGIVTEPAGAISIAALESYRGLIKGKTVVAVVSGGNNDIARTEEIKRRAKEYEMRKVQSE